MRRAPPRLRGMTLATPDRMKMRHIATVHRAMKTTSFPLVLALAVFSQGCIVVEDPSPDPSPGPAPAPSPTPTPTPAPPASSLLRIDNESSLELYEIYVTPIDATTWGPDLLGGDILFPGESFTVEVGCDFYDAMVVDEFGTECVIESLDLCGDSAIWDITNAVLSACGGDVSTLTVQNESSFVLEELYVTPVDAFDWGPDLLANDVLFPEESFTVSLGCDVYDVMVVDELGTECVLFDLDLCFEDATWVVTNIDLSLCDSAGVTSSNLSRKPRALSDKHEKEMISL
jgi:hypothetical protein